MNKKFIPNYNQNQLSLATPPDKEIDNNKPNAVATRYFNREAAKIKIENNAYLSKQRIKNTAEQGVKCEKSKNNMQVSKDLTDYELILNENNDSKAQDNKYEFEVSNILEILNIATETEKEHVYTVLNQNIHLIKQVVSLYNLINGFNVNDLHRLLIYYIKNNKPEACTIILTDLLDQNFVDIMRNCGASFVDMILCDGLSEDVDTFVLIRAIQLVCANYNSIKKFIFNGNEFDDETVDKLKNITINLFQKVPPRFVQKNSTSCNKWQFISNPEEFQSRDNIMRYIRRKNLNTLINVLMLANDVKLQVNMNSDFSINCNDINISPELLSSFKSVLTEYMIFFLKYKNMLSKDYQKSSDDTDKYFNNFDN